MKVQAIAFGTVILVLVGLGIYGALRESYYYNDERGKSIISQAHQTTLIEIYILLMACFLLNKYLRWSCNTNIFDFMGVKLLDMLPLIIYFVIWGLNGINIFILERKM